jgi:periplasmic protein CpxP/Spy
MNKKHLLKITLAVSLMMPAWAITQAADSDSDAQIEQRMSRIESQLDLSAEQKTKLQEHRKAHREKAKTLWDEYKAHKKSLAAELEKSTVDKARVQNIQNDIKGSQGRLADHRLEGVLQVREVLTPAQFKKFQELKDEMWGKKKGYGDSDKKGKGTKKEGYGDGPKGRGAEKGKRP